MKTLLLSAALAVVASTAFARDNIQVTGSSTVLPYATIVAEAFGENFEFQIMSSNPMDIYLSANTKIEPSEFQNDLQIKK